MRTGPFLARRALLVLAVAAAGAQTPPAPAPAPDAPPPAAAGRRRQELSFSEVPPHLVTDAPFRLVAKASSGLPVTFEVVDGPATIDGRTVKLSGAPGLVVIRASQPGDDVFAAAAPQERAFAVNPKPEAPAVIASPAATTVGLGEPIVLEVQATGVPAPTYQWRKDGRPIEGALSRIYALPAAALSDSGVYDLVATNPAGVARSAAVRVTVTKRHQTITFFPPSSAVAGQNVALSAMASSGLPVRFQVVSGTATLTGSSIIPNGSMVVVEADQDGDGTYEAAAPVTQTITVQPGPQALGQHY